MTVAVREPLGRGNTPLPKNFRDPVTGRTAISAAQQMRRAILHDDYVSMYACDAIIDRALHALGGAWGDYLCRPEATEEAAAVFTFCLRRVEQAPTTKQPFDEAAHRGLAIARHFGWLVAAAHLDNAWALATAVSGRLSHDDVARQAPERLDALTTLASSEEADTLVPPGVSPAHMEAASRLMLSAALHGADQARNRDRIVAMSDHVRYEDEPEDRHYAIEAMGELVDVASGGDVAVAAAERIIGLAYDGICGRQVATARMVLARNAARQELWDEVTRHIQAALHAFLGRNLEYAEGLFAAFLEELPPLAGFCSGEVCALLLEAVNDIDAWSSPYLAAATAVSAQRHADDDDKMVYSLANAAIAALQSSSRRRPEEYFQIGPFGLPPRLLADEQVKVAKVHIEEERTNEAIAALLDAAALFSDVGATHEAASATLTAAVHLREVGALKRAMSCLAGVKRYVDLTPAENRFSADETYVKASIVEAEIIAECESLSAGDNAFSATLSWIKQRTKTVKDPSSADQLPRSVRVEEYVAHLQSSGRQCLHRQALTAFKYDYVKRCDELLRNLLSVCREDGDAELALTSCHQRALLHNMGIDGDRPDAAISALEDGLDIAEESGKQEAVEHFASSLCAALEANGQVRDAEKIHKACLS